MTPPPSPAESTHSRAAAIDVISRMESNRRTFHMATTLQQQMLGLVPASTHWESDSDTYYEISDSGIPATPPSDSKDGHPETAISAATSDTVESVEVEDGGQLDEDDAANLHDIQQARLAIARLSQESDQILDDMSGRVQNSMAKIQSNSVKMADELSRMHTARISMIQDMIFRIRSIYTNKTLHTIESLRQYSLDKDHGIPADQQDCMTRMERDVTDIHDDMLRIWHDLDRIQGDNFTTFLRARDNIFQHATFSDVDSANIARVQGSIYKARDDVAGTRDAAALVFRDMMEALGDLTRLDPPPTPVEPDARPSPDDDDVAVCSYSQASTSPVPLLQRDSPFGNDDEEERVSFARLTPEEYPMRRSNSDLSLELRRQTMAMARTRNSPGQDAGLTLPLPLGESTPQRSNSGELLGSEVAQHTEGAESRQEDPPRQALIRDRHPKATGGHLGRREAVEAELLGCPEHLRDFLQAPVIWSWGMPPHIKTVQGSNGEDREECVFYDPVITW